MSQLKRRTILWERTKRPLIFVSVCLAAAFALKYLYEYRTGYNDAKNAPYIIFDNLSKEEKQNNLKAIQTTRLSEKILLNSDYKYFSPKEINRIVSNLKSQQFKDTDELIGKLNAEITVSRNNILKTLDFTVIQKELEDLSTLAASDKDYLSKKTASTEDEAIFNTKQLLTELTKSNPQPASNQLQLAENPRKYLIEYLNAFKQKPVSEQTKSNLNSAVDSFFANKRNELQNAINDKQTAINSMESNFDILKNNIFDIKRNISSVLFEVDPKAKYDVLDEQKYQLKYLFLDEKGGLNVLFKLIEVTLTVILVFGLLYIIVIPLRYIFFLSTSADILSEKAKGYLERKNEAVGLKQLGSALLLTAGTVTIGAAVVANSNPVSPLLTNANEVKNEQQSNPTTNVNPTFFKSGDVNDDTQIVINRLSSQIMKLDSSVTDLSQKIIDIQLPENKDFTIQLDEIKTDLANINTAIGTEILLKDSSNLPQKIQTMSEIISENNKVQFDDSITPIKNKIATDADYKNDKTILSRIGEIEDLFNKSGPQNPMFATLEDISKILGTNEFKAANSTPNLWQTMSAIRTNMGEQTDSQVNGANFTLFGKLNNIFDSISPEGYLNSKSSIYSTLGSNTNILNDETIYAYTRFASKTTKDVGDIGRLMIKASGNIETFFARIFEGKQLSLNPFLITELEKKTFAEEKQIALNEKQITANLLAATTTSLAKNNDLQNEINVLRESIKNRNLLIKVLVEIGKDKKISSKKYTAREIWGILIPRLVQEPKTQKEYEEARNILRENIATILQFSAVDFY